MRFLLLALLFSTSAIAQDMPVSVPIAPPVAGQVLPGTIPADSIVPTDPYTITDVIVDVSAKNAVEARAEAFAKGAEIAVQKFITAQGANVDVKTINPDRLVRDFQVTKERFSRTRYTANLTYHFKPQAMASIVNAAVPPENALPVPEDLPDTLPQDGEISDAPPPEQPVDFDQPWTPGMDRPQPAPGDVSAPVGDAMSTYPLTVSFDQVAQWLTAQDLITGRPEVRGLKMVSMSSNQAVVELTTATSAADVQRVWSGLGWPVVAAGGGLSIDATAMGH